MKNKQIYYANIKLDLNGYFSRSVKIQINCSNQRVCLFVVCFRKPLLLFDLSFSIHKEKKLNVILYTIVIPNIHT